MSMLNIFRKKGGPTAAPSSEKNSKRKETTPIQRPENGSSSTPTKSKEGEGEEEEEAKGAPVNQGDEPDKGKEEDDEVQRGDSDGNGTVNGSAIASKSVNDTADTPSGTKQNGETEKIKPSRPRPKLNAEQRHYLLKTLLQMRMQEEARDLEKLGTLTVYGAPFTATRPKLSRIKKDVLKDLADFNYGSKDESGEAQAEEEADAFEGNEAALLRAEKVKDPFLLRHLFHTHAHTLPGFDGAPPKFWTERLQPFFDEMAARNFSTSDERAEISNRHFFTLVMTRFLGAFVARGVGVRAPGELRGAGKGEHGSEKWGAGKQWGKGTVKRGLDKPARIDESLMADIDGLFGTSGKEHEVWQRAGEEWHRIQRDWRSFKEHIIENETGIDEMVGFLQIGNSRNLPRHLKNCVEYARVFVAYMLHTLFVTLPNSDDMFNILKTIHALFPYRLAKLGLKVANAEMYVRPLVSLFLARPAGSKSLLQRFFASSVSKEMETFTANAEILRKAINDVNLSKRIESYVRRGSRRERRAMRAKADEENIDVVTAILLYTGNEDGQASAKTTSSSSSAKKTPQEFLSATQKDQIRHMEARYLDSVYRSKLDAAYPAGTSVGNEMTRRPSIAQDEAATKYAQLKLLLREELKRRDREQALAVGSGSLVPTLLKDLLELVFYDALRKVSHATDLSQHLGNLQVFLDDLIKLRKGNDDSVEAWIALCARHEQSLYFLIHEVSEVAGPVWDWSQAGADYMSLGTVDPYHPADRKAGHVQVDIEKMLQDARLDDVDVETIVKETDELVEFTRWVKVRNELEMRRNYLLNHVDAAPHSGLCADDIPTKKMKEQIQDVDGLMRQLMRKRGIDEDDGLVKNPQRGTEMGEYPLLHFSLADPLRQHYVSDEVSTDDQRELRYEKQLVAPQYPSMWATRKLLIPLCESLRKQLPDWKQYEKPFRPRARPPPLVGAAAGANSGTGTGTGTVSRSASKKKSKKDKEKEEEKKKKKKKTKK